MPEEDLVELKFRLYDGSDIGPIRYSSASTIAMLKERIVSEWPRDKKIIPKAANDLKLICAGKILENNRTIGQCKTPFGELPGGIITMHVVVQPSIAKSKTGAKRNHMLSPYSPHIFRHKSHFDILFFKNMLEKHISYTYQEEKVEELPKKALCSCSIL